MTTSACCRASSRRARRDPRAPQNLVPIGALEQHLRRGLGDARLIHRRLATLPGSGVRACLNRLRPSSVSCSDRRTRRRLSSGSAFARASGCSSTISSSRGPRSSDGDQVTFYGIVDIVRKRFEGSQFDTDAFRVADGTLPADVSYAAHVQVTRVEPEVFVPPSPGRLGPGRARRGVPPRALLRSHGAQRGHRPDANGRGRPRQPRVPRRHARRARLDQRRVRAWPRRPSYATLHPLFPVPLRTRSGSTPPTPRR